MTVSKIRVKIPTKYPSSVSVASPITLNRTGGNFLFELDIDELRESLDPLYFPQVTVTGTANEVTVTNGDGALGNPTISLPTALTFAGKTVTGGTFTGLSAVGVSNSGLTKGIDVAQTATGSAGGNYQANRFRITSDNVATAGGILANVLISDTFGGSTVDGGRQGLQINNIMSATTNAANAFRVYTAATLVMDVRANDSGTGTGANAKGHAITLNTSALTAAGATFWDSVQSIQADVYTPASSSMAYRAGVTVADEGSAVQGSTWDTAFGVSALAATVGFKNAILIGDMRGFQPMASTGTLIATTGSVSVAKGIDFSSATFSGNQYTGPGAAINSGGAAQFISTTAPLVIGGTGAASTLTLESTSGAGTTDSIKFRTASQADRMQITTGGLVHIGPAVTPLALVTINQNTVAAASASVAPALQVSGADAASPLIIADSYGTGQNPFVSLRAARGTAASFTATQSGDALGFFGMVGATAANTFANARTAAGGIYFGGTATETWSVTNQGARIDFYTTTNATASINKRMQLAEGLSVNTATDPGAGNLIMTGSPLALSATAIPAGGTAGAGYKFSSTSNFGVFFGSGAPSLAAAKGSLYLRSDGSTTNDRAYINTNGSTTWTALTTAA